MTDFPVTSLSTLQQDPAKMERVEYIIKIREMRWCSERCPAFELCPAVSTAMEHEGSKKPCALRDQPMTVRKRFEHLFLSGQDGLIQELMTSLYRVGQMTDTSGDLADHRAYTQLVLNTHKTLYGEKLEVSSDQPTKVNIQVMDLEDIIEMEETADGTFKDKDLSEQDGNK